MMPRFTVRTLLIIFAVVALWLSTFFVTFQGTTTLGYNIRRLLVLVGFLAAASSAVYLHGRRRAFWGSFTVMMLVLTLSISTRPPYILNPNIEKIAELLRNGFLQGRSSDEVETCAHETFYLVILLSMSFLMGFVSAWIYGHAKGTSNG
jgi:hypothetical protein